MNLKRRKKCATGKKSGKKRREKKTLWNEISKCERQAGKQNAKQTKKKVRPALR